MDTPVGTWRTGHFGVTASTHSLLRPVSSRSMARTLRHVSVALLLVLSLLATPTHAFIEPVAPWNHRPVSEGAVCVAAGLPTGDFCADVVTYPVSSRLLHERVEEGVLSPVHRREEHGRLLRENHLEAVLSPRAEAEYDVLRQAHLEQAAVDEALPGGSRFLAAAAGDDPASVANLPIPGQDECDAVLRRYACQNQYPRCVADEAYLHETGRPIELHTCYALCHEVIQRCHLRHRVNCHVHHARLDPLHVQPSEHVLRFDARFKDTNPTAKFWHVDCIDSPPSTTKHVSKWLLHGGPALYLMYSVAAIVLYAIASAALGLRGESATKVLLRIRRERRHRRTLYDAAMRRAQRRFVKLQEIKTSLLDAQEADQAALSELPDGKATPRLQAAMAERKAKLAQLDNLLEQLEAHVQAEQARMHAARLREVREDADAGRLKLDSISPSRVREYVSAGSAGPLSLASSLASDESFGPDEHFAADALAVADALADEEEEEARLLGRDVLPDASMEEAEEAERDAGIKSFGRRRRAAPTKPAASSPSPASPFSPRSDDDQLDYDFVDHESLESPRKSQLRHR